MQLIKKLIQYYPSIKVSLSSMTNNYLHSKPIQRKLDYLNIKELLILTNPIYFTLFVGDNYYIFI